ncbi:hypothetical protein KKG66_01960 [bacterium]|nr:hypothetical protein [bacterium]
MLLHFTSLTAQTATLADAENQADSVLSLFGMNRDAFIVDRVWVQDDTFLVDIVQEALSSPFAGLQVSRRIADTTPISLKESRKVNGMMRLVDAVCPDFVCADIDSQLAYAPPVSENHFEPMLSAFALAEGYRQQAFDSLTADQRQALLLGSTLWFEDEDNPDDDSLKGLIFRSYDVDIDTTQPVGSDSVLTLLALINRNALAASIYAFARGLEEAVSLWDTLSPPQSTMKPNVPGAQGEILAVRETPFGIFIIGGEGANTYDGSFAFILDLGGDDYYSGHSASAVAGIGNSISVIIDLGGNDHYENTGIAGQACGVMGLAAIYDRSGNDVYRSGMFSQASAFCGAGLLFDESGDDIYRSGIFSQAAAICGLALLCDGDGQDIYNTNGYGQAFSSTFGIAALCDGAGNDTYRAGGLLKHEPLRPEDYRSLSQGFSIGARPRGGGGLAMLRDISGNDFYDAEIYAQGVGYWYSLGYLLDESGNDTYNATQYSQGAGIHLAVGVLEDRSGDDRYGSRFGPGQGSAHDLSVGVLYEHSGDDQYTISGGQGVAITNSAAVFLDARGNDTYTTTEPLGQGGVRGARGFGNLALFVDGEGKDSYNGPLGADSSVWSRSAYGIAVDVPLDIVTEREAPVEVTLAPEDTQRTVEEIFNDAALWEVTDNREKVRRGRLALIAKGMDAVRWVAENKLNTTSGLERRAIIELYKEYPDSAKPFLIDALEQGNYDTRRNVLALFGELKSSGVTDLLQDKLHKTGFERLRPAILSTLGDIGDTLAAPMIVHYTTSDIERERLAAVNALGDLHYSPAYPAILDGLKDKLFTVRSAAIYAIAKQRKDIMPEIETRFLSRDIDELEGLMLAVAMLADSWSSDDKTKKDVKSLEPLVRRFLEHPDARVKGAAIVAASSVLSEKNYNKIAKRFAQSEDLVIRARLSQANMKYQ